MLFADVNSPSYDALGIPKPNIERVVAPFAFALLPSTLQYQLPPGPPPTRLHVIDGRSDLVDLTTSTSLYSGISYCQIQDYFRMKASSEQC